MSESQNTKDQQRQIDAIYEAVRLLQYIEDETSYIDSREKFIAQFPEYAGQIPEEYHAAEVKNCLHQLYQVLVQLPIEIRDAVKECGIRIDAARFHATRALKRNIQRVFPGDPPTSDIDSALPSLIEELERRTNNPQGTLKENTENERMLTESRLADVLSVMCKTLLTENAISGDPIGVMCTMFDMGRITGLLESLTPEWQELNLLIYPKIKGSESITERRWKPRKELISQALEIAKKKWNEGDNALTTEMRDYLCDGDRFPEFKDISKQEMLRAVRTVAPPDRIFGKKGVKKKK